MTLEKFIGALAKPVAEHRILRSAREGRMTAEEFRLLTIERHHGASGFVPLLEAGIALGQAHQETNVANALRRNWRDETGMDAASRVIPDRAHTNWRDWYLDALSIPRAELPLTAAGTNYLATLVGPVERHDAIEIAALILFLEYFIPLEFAAIKTARDRIFPEVFVDALTDDEDTRYAKSRRRLYLDDHIRHDAGYHFPDLAVAISPYWESANDLPRVINGLFLGRLAKQVFYDTLAIEAKFGW